MRAIVFNPSITRMMGLVSIPFALVAAFAVYPMASHGHGKGIYKSKAEAEQRASEIGC